MSGEVRLTHRSGAVVTAGLQADGHWIVTAADAQGVAFALGVPPHFQHAEHSGAALLLVGEYAGTHYSLAITPTELGFQFEFAERWNDRATRTRIAVGLPCRPDAELKLGAGMERAPDGVVVEVPESARRAEYAIDWMPGRTTAPAP